MLIQITYAVEKSAVALIEIVVKNKQFRIF